MASAISVLERLIGNVVKSAFPKKNPVKMSAGQGNQLVRGPVILKSEGTITVTRADIHKHDLFQRFDRDWTFLRLVEVHATCQKHLIRVQKYYCGHSAAVGQGTLSTCVACPCCCCY